MAFKTARHYRHHLSNPKVVFAVLVIIVLLFIFISLPNIPTISSNKDVQFSTNSSFNFRLPGNSSIVSVFLASSSNSSSTVYISKIPVLERHIQVARLQKGTPVNVSLYGSGYADLQMLMKSGTANNATISLSYIPNNLRISPTVLQYLNSTSFGKTTITIPTTVYTTSTQTSTSTVVTTAPVTNQTLQALIYANQSEEGALMVNYDKLYRRAASQCTPSQYNNTYAQKHGTVPKGPSTFANVTMASPKAIFSSVPQKVTGDVYLVTYTAQIPIGNLGAMQLQINALTRAVTSYTFLGIFQGFTFSTALQNYQAMNLSTNPCMPYIS